MCKYQLCNLCLHGKHLRSGHTWEKAARHFPSLDTCARILKHYSFIILLLAYVNFSSDRFSVPQNKVESREQTRDP